MCISISGEMPDEAPRREASANDRDDSDRAWSSLSP
jgi:hypothetical protein